MPFKVSKDVVLANKYFGLRCILNWSEIYFEMKTTT